MSKISPFDKNNNAKDSTVIASNKDIAKDIATESGKFIFTNIENDRVNVFEDEDFVAKHHRKTIESLRKPTKQDRYLYKHYGSLPMKTEKTMSLPYVEELIEQQFNADVNFGKRCYCKFESPYPSIRYEIKNIYLYLKIDDPKQLLTSIGDMINSVEFEINKHRVQRYTGNFLQLNSQLERNQIMPSKGTNEIWIPIPMTFHQDTPFPAYYLKKHQMATLIEFASLSEEAKVCGTKILKASIFVEYQLPNPINFQPFKVDELNPIRYLWEDVQYAGREQIQHGMQAVKLRLNFNRPVKTLIWNTYYQNKDGRRVEPSEFSIIDQAKLQINGNDITKMMSSSYFNTVMPNKFGKNPTGNPNLYVHTFANQPNWIRPTGTLDFSAIDTSCLQMNFSSETWKQIPKDYDIMCEIYAVGYNIMEIDPDEGIGFIFMP